jgi:predicted DCC family thiol-disulfide oxidoreductase YuxK
MVDDAKSKPKALRKLVLNYTIITFYQRRGLSLKRSFYIDYMDIPHDKSLILYDGECALCQGSVQWVLKRDRHARFVYASRQGERGRRVSSELMVQNTNSQEPGVRELASPELGMRGEAQNMDAQKLNQNATLSLIPQTLYEFDSFVLVHGGEFYQRSTAALKVTRLLGFPYSLLALNLIVPRFIRDGVYNFIGRHRYQWFGKSDSCWLPRDEWRSRFLD